MGANWKSTEYSLLAELYLQNTIFSKPNFQVGGNFFCGYKLWYIFFACYTKKQNAEITFAEQIIIKCNKSSSKNFAKIMFTFPDQ